MAVTKHPKGRQRGVVLFIALIAMVVLTLAGVALIRSVDTTGSVAGNIAFREAAMAATNLSLEKAVDALFITKSINPELDDTGHHYYARLQLGEKPSGVPALLAGTYTTMNAAYTAALGPPDIYNPTIAYPASNAEVRSVIERVCDPATPLPPALTFAQKLQYCDELAPKLSFGKTSMKLGGPTLPPFPLFRVTVRVDLPGTNTTAYAQTMLR
jgi:hypothetical protein